MSELAVAQCSSFFKNREWIHAMYFVVMFECCSIFILMHLVGHLLIIADRCHICFAYHSSVFMFEFAYEDQVNSENFAGKMTIPSKSLLSLLARCSLFCYAYAMIPTTCFIMPPILPCETSNPPCPSKPLFGYVTALLSPSYSVVSCR